jgi:3-hydroxyisobutyrate dehydrogenase-like beta-hydroxyacid dehydrogenase
MSDISMIGLGAMGTALAKAQVNAGHDVTVWNRSPHKMTPLLELGAKGAENVAAAVKASPLIMVCIDNYQATNALLRADDVVAHLSGRSVIQLSTGTPSEARDSETWLTARGAAYLDGIIEPYPDGIGTSEAQLLFSGSKEVFETSQAFLRCLGGDLRFISEQVGAAAALDLAGLSWSLGMYVGFVHGARLCEVEGVGLDQFAALYPEGNRMRELAEIIHAEAFTLGSLHPGASIRVWEECIQRLQFQARDAGMSSEFPDNISGIFNRAIAAGHGEEDLAALVKVLRDDKGD